MYFYAKYTLDKAKKDFIKKDLVEKSLLIYNCSSSQLI